MPARSKWLVPFAGFLAVVLLAGFSCDHKDDPFKGLVPFVAASTTREVFTYEVGPDGLFFADGTFQFKGTVPAGTAATSITLIIEHLNAASSVVSSIAFDLPVDGTRIPKGTFDMPGMVLAPGEALRVSIRPVGGDLEFGMARFHWQFRS
jgi:hypothetical protein